MLPRRRRRRHILPSLLLRLQLLLPPLLLRVLRRRRRRRLFIVHLFGATQKAINIGWNINVRELDNTCLRVQQAPRQIRRRHPDSEVVLTRFDFTRLPITRAANSLGECIELRLHLDLLFDDT